MKGGHLTLYVGECHVEFTLFENQNILSSSSTLEEDMDFPEIGPFNNWWDVDPFMFECVTFVGLGLDYVRVEFNAPTTPSIVKDEIYAINEVSMSDYCRFA